jgi:hypothetical protein
MRTVSFNHTYRGVTTGISTKRDVRKKLGFPFWIFFYWKFRARLFFWQPNPRHDGIEVRVSESDGRVHLIAISVPGYVDANGISVGEAWSQVENYFGKTIGPSMIDEKKGIIYHSLTYKNEVDVIVLKGSLEVN